MVDGMHGDIVITGSESRLLKHNTVQDVLEEVDCPVLVIR
jgi:hypothetical protein